MTPTSFLWLETILQDLRFALRSLRSHPGVSALALVSLALAIGANTAIFSVVDAVLLRALPYREANRIVVLRLANALNGGVMNVGIAEFEDWQHRARTL